MHQNLSPEESSILLLGHVLELLNISRKNEKADLWVISSSLSKIASYNRAFMYSPQLSAYRGMNMVEHLLKGMRESNVADLPAKEQTAEYEMVLSKICDKGTHHRNLLKTVIKGSLEPGSEIKNVAALAAKLLQGSTIKADLQFYCFVKRTYKWLTEEIFWIQVDELIEKYCKDCATTKELDGSCLEASAKVLPNPKNAQILAVAYVATMGTNTNKRCRIGSEEEEEE
ncbi:hypothetical protein DFH09DRAFT_1096983 [Mycena vulgaris]|nr:hypothetical protein DFH09DRAFT_1096983 [Mycena vulgaris]